MKTVDVTAQTGALRATAIDRTVISLHKTEDKNNVVLMLRRYQKPITEPADICGNDCIHISGFTVETEAYQPYLVGLAPLTAFVDKSYLSMFDRQDM